MAVNTKAMAGVRAKRAKIILEIGLLRREGNTFYVGSPTQKNVEFKVWRDENSRVRCSCNDFAELSVSDYNFRCEHILAVKESLAQKKQDESEMDQPETAEAPSTVTRPAASTSSRLFDSAPPREPEFEPTEPEATEASEWPAVRRPEPAANGNFTQLLAKLSQPFSPEDIKRRYGWEDRQGNAHYVDYVEWHTVADFLDETYPEWSHAVKSVQQIGDFVAVTVAITIEGVTREGVGTGPAFSEMGIKKAEHDALKRAAVKFGIARALYKDDDEETETKGSNFPRDPLAKDLDDLVTPRQLVAIKAIASSVGVEPDQECRDLLKCDLKELNRKAASAFIDYLKSKQGQTNDLRKAV